MIFKILLMTHIIGGATALFSAVVSMSTKKGSKWHRIFGRYFFYGMTIVFLTALPMSYLRPNLFLFLIAMFSYYLAYSGWRYSKMKNNIAKKSDFVVAYFMLAVSAVMLGSGIWKFNLQSFESISLWVFGFFGAIISRGDLKFYQQGKIPVKLRISKHLGAMIGGTIAASTAFAVNTIHIQPEIVVWLMPTILFTPLIFYWNKRYLSK